MPIGMRCQGAGSEAAAEEIDILEIIVVNKQRHIGGGTYRGVEGIVGQVAGLRTLPEARTMLDHAKRASGGNEMFRRS